MVRLRRLGTALRGCAPFRCLGGLTVSHRRGESHLSARALARRFLRTLPFSRRDRRSALKFGNLMIYIDDWRRIMWNWVPSLAADASAAVTFAWRNRAIAD